MKQFKRILRAGLCICLAAVMTGGCVLNAAASAGEDPGTVDDKDKIFPDPDSFSYDDVEVNFAKALQYSLYFYDANKCGKWGGRLEWRSDCHMEDAAIPLKHWETGMGTPIGVNVSDEWIAEHIDILDPDGDGCIDCEGGMHDAGDHVKFGLPGSYAASTLAWGYYEFREAYEKTGNAEHMEEILHWFADFYTKGIYYNEDGSVLAYVYQVGEGNCDHNYWIAPDLQGTHLLDFGRPAYLATTETPASDMCAGTSAMLGICYLIFKESEPEFAAKCLKGAHALYDFAVETHSELLDDDGKPIVGKVSSLGYDGGFYTSSYDYDELSWAAIWLYECEMDIGKIKQDVLYDTYIDPIIHVDTDVFTSNDDPTVLDENKAHPYTGYIRRIIADTGNCWQNIWVHCWDDVWGGVFAKLAPITNCSRDWYIFRWNLEFWSGMTESDAANAPADQPAAVTKHKYFGPDDKLWKTTVTAEEIKDLPEADGAFLLKTPAGFAMLNDYGSARYCTAAGLCACVYAKETGDKTFSDWAERQMEYIMGKNPMNRPYIVGYSDTAASHPHHRAAHGSLDLNMDHPADQTHILWGALVGGPDAKDWHRDLTKDYVYNEVAVDYNAGFVGDCAGLYALYGTEDMKPVENFPPLESSYKTEEELREFTLKAAVGQEDDRATQVLIEICNQTSRPPRYLDEIKVRYYFNISEVLAAGGSVDDVKIRVDYDEMRSKTDAEYCVSYEVVPTDDKGECYVEFTWADYKFIGTLQFQFAIECDYQDENYKHVLDPTNDYSRETLHTATELDVPLREAPEYTDGLTMYVEGTHVWGVGPDGVEPANDEPVVTDNNDYGDVDCNGKINIADAILLSQYTAEITGTKISAQGLINAQCCMDDVLDSADTTRLLEYLAGIVPKSKLGT